MVSGSLRPAVLEPVKMRDTIILGGEMENEVWILPASRKIKKAHIRIGDV